MNGIAFCTFRNRNSSQKNLSAVSSGIVINGIVPKKRTLVRSLSVVTDVQAGLASVLLQLRGV